MLTQKLQISFTTVAKPPFLFILFHSVREPIQNRIYSCEKTRFFCNHLTVVSRCYSGMVSIDGKYRYSLPAGSKACFETNKETQLCTFDSLDSSG